ncbi:MAG: STAS domain-containing protein [Candidatus Eisenbacteria bacterium]|nr:STAS domain-containing protein [Candidatus Eisenbacteria bacterium]
MSRSPATQGAPAAHWGMLSGDWGAEECRELLGLLERVYLRPDTWLVLDLSHTTHVHYRAVPILMEIARRCAARAVRVRLTGVSSYVRRIVEFACAQAGRDFLDGYSGVCSPLLGHAGLTVAEDGPGRWGTDDPHGLAVPSPN